MRHSKAQIIRRVHSIPELRFEDQRLSSFSGLVVIQAPFKKLNLRARLKQCFQHIKNNKVICFSITTMLLIIH